MSPTDQLTPAQQRVPALLSAGSTTAAAQFVGVHRNTGGNWLRASAFRDALTETRRDQDLAWREQTRSLAAQALGAIQAVLADPQAPAAVPLDAALAVQGRPRAKSPAQPHTKPAIPHPVGRPSRNQPCPCGSGRKFKRCCMSIR
jgi:preprotein translocase subunit SecA